MRRSITILAVATFLAALLVMAGNGTSHAATDLVLDASADGGTARVIAGSDRYETAVLVSQAAFPQGAPAVVLARGDDFADALCSAPLAYAYGGPLLLTPKSGLPEAVVSELRRLSPSQVFLVGIGDGSSPLLAQIKSVTGPQSVTTLIGKDRYETAALVADRLQAEAGPPDKVVIAPGDSFPDALAVGPLAAVNHWPILYTPRQGSLPQVTLDEIAKLGVDSALEIGTYAPVDLPDVVRRVGVDRYHTSTLIADYALGHGLSAAHVAFATGEKFPDGLAAAPYLALDGGVLLLTKGATTPARVEEFLSPRAAGIRVLEAIGLSAIPAGPWLSLFQAPNPPFSGQDDSQPDPETTSSPVRSRTSTTTSSPTSADPALEPPNTTTTSPVGTTTTTERQSTPPTSRQSTPPTSAPSPTTTTPSPSGSIGPVVLRGSQVLQNVSIVASTSKQERAISGAGLSGAVVRNVTTTGGRYGMKIGSGADSSLTVNGLTVRDAPMGIFLADVVNSSFTDLDIYAPRQSGNQEHAAYLERGLHGVTIRDSVFRGGSGYTVHLWHDTGSSDTITFINCTIDARSGRYPVVIGPGFDNIKFLDCTFIGGSSGPIVQFMGGSNILFDGFTASGGSSLVAGSCQSATMRNGTYRGPQLGKAGGVAFQNVQLN